MPKASPSAAANRIRYLDGLRGIAILWVMTFHYFFRYVETETPIYPYGDFLAEISPFKYGLYGVHLFFGISGFVIALTLERCRTLDEFAVRRMARLLPTVFLCSLLTYAVLTLWPAFWPQVPANFLPSLTLIAPEIWNRVLPNLNSAWVDGAYWSLWVEIRFYAWAAVVYFLSQKRFVLFFSVFSSLAVLTYASLHHLGKSSWAGLVDTAFAAQFLPWFMIGIAAISYSRRNVVQAYSLVLIAMLLIAVLGTVKSSQSELLAGCFVVFLLFAPLRVRWLQTVLGQSWLVGIGVASYSLYLLHQRVGLTLINAGADWFGLIGPASLIAVAIVALLLIATSRTIFRFWESPINRWTVMVYQRFRNPGSKLKAQ